jgi:hypothetical protein
MATSKPIERIIYTDGSNGIVRLPPLIWRAFYEAALYLEIDSVQECFLLYLLAGGWLHKRLDFVQVVETLEGKDFDELLVTRF